MRLLRDLRESTTVLLLLSVTTNRHTRLKTLADDLGMTVQGASDYARRLTDEGLLQIVDGEYRATMKGVEFLQERFRELRTFVERASRSMALVETTVAFAGEPLRKGDPVGLFMEGGFLVARRGRDSPSMGVAAEDAGKGEDVAVRDLEGIVALRPGRITLARVPPSRTGGAKGIHPGPSKRIRDRAGSGVVAGLDVPGIVAVRRLGLRPRIEFGVLAAAIEAAEQGVDVLLVVPEDRAADAVQAIEAANARLEEKIPYESVALR